MDFSHDTYISPLTWRYGSTEMRHLWSEIHKRRLLRRVWLALAEAQHEADLVTREQLADLQAHVTEVDIARASVIEAETKHDLVAELQTYAEQCVVGDLDHLFGKFRLFIHNVREMVFVFDES